MTKEEIMKYVKESPENMNIAVFESILDSYVESAGDDRGTYLIVWKDTEPANGDEIFQGNLFSVGDTVTCPSIIDPEYAWRNKIGDTLEGGESFILQEGIIELSPSGMYFHLEQVRQQEI